MESLIITKCRKDKCMSKKRKGRLKDCNNVTRKETWNLDQTIAKFIIPRLKLFKEAKDCYPHQLDNMGEWDAIIDTMLDAFSVVSEKTASERSDSEMKIVEEGLDLFRKHFNDLWW